MADAALSPIRLDPGAFLPFRGDPSRAVPIAQMRSTVLVAGMQRLREANAYEAFLGQLSGAVREEMMSLTGGQWVDARLVHEYYRALDALAFSHRQILEMTGGVAVKLKDSFLSLVLQASRGAGVTPWTALAHAHGFLARVSNGGDFEVVELGPKDARLVWVGNPFARYRYFRIGILGTLPALVGAFCQRAYVRDIPQLCDESTLAYRAAWV